MQPGDFKLTTPLDVRWGEVDAHGVVYFVNYQLYFDLAFAAYWSRLGYPLPDGLPSRFGVDLMVRQSSVEYFAPARCGDRLQVGCRTMRIGRTSVTQAFGVFRDGMRLASGELVSVFVAMAERRASAVPIEVRARIAAFEDSVGLDHLPDAGA